MTNTSNIVYILQLAQAKQVFSQIARGPACDKYMKQLEDSCDRYWKNGRQLCEEVSLLGNHCVNPVSHCVNPVSHCVQLVSHCLNPVSHCVNPVSHCEVSHCVIPVSHCVNPVSHCVKLASHCHCVIPVGHFVNPVSHCVNPVSHCVALMLYPLFQLHRTEDDIITDDMAHLPVSQHSSQLKMKAACNCGRKQADKDDPFDHKVRICRPKFITFAYTLFSLQ